MPEYTIVYYEKSTVGTLWHPLIPRIESAEVGSKPLAYLIRPGSDFRGDRIRCDTGVIWKLFWTAHKLSELHFEISQRNESSTLSFPLPVSHARIVLHKILPHVDRHTRKLNSARLDPPTGRTISICACAIVTPISMNKPLFNFTGE